MINYLYEAGIYKLNYNNELINLGELLNHDNLAVITQYNNLEFYNDFEMSEKLNEIHITNSDFYYYILNNFINKDRLTYQRSGNYDYPIFYIFNLPEFNLELTQILGAVKSHLESDLKIPLDSDNLIGFIIKIPGHYVCIKRFGINNFYKIDSMSALQRMQYAEIIAYIHELYESNKRHQVLSIQDYSSNRTRKAYKNTTKSNLRDTRANMVFSLSHKIHGSGESSS